MARRRTDHHLADGFYGGALPTKPNVKDRRFLLDARAPLPSREVSLIDRMPVPSDQGQTGSCGAHAAAKLRHAAVNAWRQATGQPLQAPDAETFSELWIYYWTRRAMNTFPTDSGSDNRALLQAMVDRGFVLEDDLPWDVSSAPQDITRDLGGEQPPSDAFYGISGYQAVGRAGAAMPGSIAASLQEGYPCLVAIGVWQNFFDNPTAPMPRGQLLGYHDIPVHTYRPDPSVPGGGKFGWRVSWAGFGDENGDAWLPVSYVAGSRYCLEAWRLV